MKARGRGENRVLFIWTNGACSCILLMEGAPNPFGAAGIAKERKMVREPEVTYKIMSAIKSKNTKPELLLAKELWRRGMRYRKNYAKLPGKPDLVFVKARLAVFCDGDFWHGHNWVLRGYGSLKEEVSRYSAYWAEKIMNNVARDERVNARLEEAGWTVIRVWESDIKRDLQACADQIQTVYSRKMSSLNY